MGVTASELSMAVTAEVYAKRTYGSKATTKNLTDFDRKMIQSLIKFRAAHKEALEKRKCIVFLEEAPKDINRAINKPSVVAETKICTATKMNGEPCSAKAKPGKCFCGRHAKLEL